jgi:hypothetical protein
MWRKRPPNPKQKTNLIVISDLRAATVARALRVHLWKSKPAGEMRIALSHGFAECLTTLGEYDNNGAGIGARIYSGHTASCPESTGRIPQGEDGMDLEKDNFEDDNELSGLEEDDELGGEVVETEEEELIIGEEEPEKPAPAARPAAPKPAAKKPAKKAAKAKPKPKAKAKPKKAAKKKPAKKKGRRR